MSKTKKSKMKIVDLRPQTQSPMNRQERLLALDAALEACREILPHFDEFVGLVQIVEDQLHMDYYPSWEMFECAQFSAVNKLAANPEVYGGAE